MLPIKKLNLFSFALFQGYLFALIGGLCGIVYSVGGFFIDLFVSLNWITSTETPGLSYGTIVAFLALLGMPLIFWVLGCVLGIIEAIFFNFISKFFGGFSLKYTN